jgi:hypothetical protein
MAPFFLCFFSLWGCTILLGGPAFKTFLPTLLRTINIILTVEV